MPNSMPRGCFIAVVTSYAVEMYSRPTPARPHHISCSPTASTNFNPAFCSRLHNSVLWLYGITKIPIIKNALDVMNFITMCFVARQQQPPGPTYTFLGLHTHVNLGIACVILAVPGYLYSQSILGKQAYNWQWLNILIIRPALWYHAQKSKTTHNFLWPWRNYKSYNPLNHSYANKRSGSVNYQDQDNSSKLWPIVFSIFES